MQASRLVRGPGELWASAGFRYTWCMGRKILVGLLVLAGVGCGVLFFAVTFHHGWNEGVIRLRRMEGPGLVFGVGTLAFLVGAFAARPKGASGG